MRGYLYIMMAAIAAGAWSVLMARAAKGITPIFGLIVSEVTAVLIALVAMAGLAQRGHRIRFDRASILYLVAAGVCVFLVDLMSLRAYRAGVPVSAGAPILTGVAVVVAASIGIMTGEPPLVTRVVGISLILVGILLVAR